MSSRRPADLSTDRIRLVALSPSEAAALLSTGLPLPEPPLDSLEAGRGWPHADTADALGMHAAHGSLGPYGAWLVVVDGAVIGDVGCHGGPDADGVVEIGYGLAAPYRGNGYAGEAVSALLSMLREQPEVRTIRATTERGNLPSQRLLERLGLVQSGVEGESLLVYVDGG